MTKSDEKEDGDDSVYVKPPSSIQTMWLSLIITNFERLLPEDTTMAEHTAKGIYSTEENDT